MFPFAPPASPEAVRLRAEIRTRRPAGRVIVAIDGRDGAGKTTLARDLGRAFAEASETVFVASLDDFHRPRADRYARGRESPEGHYRDSYDLGTFRRVLAEPFRQGALLPDTGFQLRAFDLERDAPVESRWESAGPDAVLIVEGLFALRPELRDLWDESVWIDVPDDVAGARMRARDGAGTVDSTRYREGFALYEREEGPRGRATIVVDADGRARAGGDAP